MGDGRCRERECCRVGDGVPKQTLHGWGHPEKAKTQGRGEQRGREREKAMSQDPGDK